MAHYCSKGHENPPGGRFCIQCGEKLESPVTLGIQPGQVLGARYRIVRDLGRGGFGRTYLAEDINRFNELCVLKEFAPQVQGTYALQKAEELFGREAGVLYQLQHPQIPKFREMFRIKQQDKGLLLLVQDFVEGQTYHALLEARQRQGLRFNEGEVTQLLLQILPVLVYIHSLGVIHRDISPDNLILRSRDGLPVLIDFGGVKQVAAIVASQFIGSTPTGGMPGMPTRLGKVGYAPQEQMQGGIVYPHSDLYALGVTVLVLLTGKEPQQLIDSETLEWQWRREVHLSPKLGGVLERMLQPRPSDRFSTATQVLQALTTTPPPVASVPIQTPLPQTGATLAVVPPPARLPVNSPSGPVIGSSVPDTTSQSRPLGKILLVFVLITIAGGIGWVAGNLWIQSQRKLGESQPSPTDETPVVLPTKDAQPQLSQEFSAQEQQRKETLRQRRLNLGIDYQFYNNLVDQVFWTEYPNQRGRQLGSGSEDANMRSRWDATAADLLDKIALLNLSTASRQQLGRYSREDLHRAKAEVNRRYLSSRALYDLADAKFFLVFPQQQGQDFLNQPIGQLWQAIVADTLKTVKTGAAFEQITFDPGRVNKQVSGTLQPGEGKAFIAHLSAGQSMNVKLTAPEKAKFSIYSPKRNTPLLEDSRDSTWSGRLPESGYYEFVVVCDGQKTIKYQLDLLVENSLIPEASPKRE